MVARSNRVAEGATDNERGAALTKGFDDLTARIRALEQGRNRGPGSSYGLPFILVGTTGNWTLSQSGANLVVTGPLGTVTVVAVP